jgi:peptidoglycan hydrolase-like amidase
MKTLSLKKIIVVFSCLLLLSSIVGSVSVYARSVEEINADIAKTQADLSKTKSDLDKANKELAATQAQKNSTNSELNKVKSEISIIQQNISLNNLKKAELDQSISLKNLEKEEKERLMDNQIVNTYINWKTEDYTSSLFFNGTNIIKNVIYYEFISNETERGIEDLAGEIDILNQNSENFKLQIQELQNQIVSLNEKKKFWDEQVKLYEASVARAKATQNQLQVTSSQLESQQKNFNVELEKAVAAANSGSQALITGQTYFTGSVSLPRNNVECTGNYKWSGFDPGTDAFGHGIGMSQWGANGMAWQGKNFTQILTFYYPGSTVEARPARMIKVNGVDSKTMEEYVSGIGEVTDKACGTAEKISAWNDYANAQGWAGDDPKREKYLLGGDCWPEEAIKAQVVAARSYAYNRNTSICTTDACQVYKGGFGKAWAAWETKDQVILSGDAVIDAFYSGYNNNGAGNADIDTVWPASSAKSYLKSVNDNAFTTNPRLCGQNISRQEWRTNSYSIANISEMLNWASSSTNWTDYNAVEYSSGCGVVVKGFNYAYNACVVRNKIKAPVGNLVGISATRDASGRVKKINFVGDKGQASVSGIFFRMMFNTWAGRTGKDDGLKSITFNLLVAQ